MGRECTANATCYQGSDRLTTNREGDMKVSHSNPEESHSTFHYTDPF